jgi:hypothetical protein
LWDYLFDARPGLEQGYFAFHPYPTIEVGDDWTRLVVHDRGNGTRRSKSGRLSGNQIVGGNWQHIYVEAQRSFTGVVHIFSRFQLSEDELGVGMEDLHAKLLSVSMWGRPLTDTEIDDLASGGLGGSRAPGSAFATRCPQLLLTHCLSWPGTYLLPPESPLIVAFSHHRTPLPFSQVPLGHSSHPTVPSRLVLMRVVGGGQFRMPVASRQTCR